jgi:hypothetical protein
LRTQGFIELDFLFRGKGKESLEHIALARVAAG